MKKIEHSRLDREKKRDIHFLNVLETTYHLVYISSFLNIVSNVLKNFIYVDSCDLILIYNSLSIFI